MSYTVRALHADYLNVPARKAYLATDDEGSTILIAVYSREQWDAAVAEYGDSHDAPASENAATALTGWYEFYRGVGRAFGGYPSVRLGKRNVRITQFRGLDI